MCRLEGYDYSRQDSISIQNRIPHTLSTQHITEQNTADNIQQQHTEYYTAYIRHTSYKRQHTTYSIQHNVANRQLKQIKYTREDGRKYATYTAYMTDNRQWQANKKQLPFIVYLLLMYLLLISV